MLAPKIDFVSKKRRGLGAFYFSAHKGGRPMAAPMVGQGKGVCGIHEAPLCKGGSRRAGGASKKKKAASLFLEAKCPTQRVEGEIYDFDAQRLCGGTGQVSLPQIKNRYAMAILDRQSVFKIFSTAEHNPSATCGATSPYTGEARISPSVLCLSVSTNSIFFSNPLDKSSSLCYNSVCLLLWLSW